MHKYDFVIVGNADVGHRKFGCPKDRSFPAAENRSGSEIFFSLRATYGVAFDARLIVFGWRKVRFIFEFERNFFLYFKNFNDTRS